MTSLLSQMHIPVISTFIAGGIIAVIGICGLLTAFFSLDENRTQFALGLAKFHFLVGASALLAICLLAAFSTLPTTQDCAWQPSYFQIIGKKIGDRVELIPVEICPTTRQIRIAKPS